MTRARTLGAAAATLVCSGSVLSAYLTFGVDVNGRTIGLRWATMPIRYFVTNRDVADVTAPQLQSAAQQAFGAWAAGPTVSISSQFGGFTSAEPSKEDGVNVIGFRARPDLERTLGATSFVIDDVTGQLQESDIFLNSSFDWSASATGQSGRFDVQSILTHEVGHLLGLGHSALGETEIRPTGGRRVLGKQAIMFPIAFPSGNTADRTPKPDDVAGMGEVYSSAGFTQRFGQISGKITLNGRGLFGAHVTAFNPATGDLISGFSLNKQGGFTIGGLAPGLYVVRAEPLDDADLDSFFDSDTVVEVNFKPTFYARLVAVGAGGAGVSADIAVTSK